MANYQTKQEKPEAMDEAMSLTQLGCKLARELESNLPNLANQPNLLSISIDEILKAFTSARGKLLSPDQIQIISSFAQMLPQAETQQAEHANLLIHEWPRSGFPQPGDLTQTQQHVQAPKSTTAIGGIMEFSKQMIRSRGEGSERSRGSEGEVQPMEASPSPSRQRRRKDNDAEKETVVVAAPQYGNTEVPPEDGYTWRKYGQKEILGSKYPRSYYRCTHQKLCECPAKKQVQRLDSNPNLFHVTYRGKHTCHMSSTAPSSIPPRLLVNISRDMTQSTISPQSSASHSLSGWLSTAHLSLPGGSTMAPVGAGDAGAGPSTSSSRYGGRGDNTNDYDPAVTDLADAMFNSGSSSSNSMELIFRSEDKYEPADKKS